ncbi:MAG: hypothetical protein ACO3FD_00325 [Flavobacteriaceae bacterium]
MSKSPKERWVVQREILLRLNYMAVLICSATAIKLALEQSYTVIFFAAIAFAILLFINAKALKPQKHV